MHIIRIIICVVFRGELQCIFLKLSDKIWYQEEASSISVAGSPEKFQDG